MIDPTSSYLLALNHIRGLGPKRARLLLEYFSDPKIAWEANRTEWESIRVPEKVVENWQTIKNSIIPEQLPIALKARSIDFLTIFDERYPVLLKEIYDAPMVIYYKGDIGVLGAICLAVVGTRKISGYGRVVTEKFSSYFASSGITVVSGLARGVDTVAHQSAIKIGGKTAAILGGGLNNIFPPENRTLAEEISSGFGVVLSEFLPDEPSLPGNFPARNRIISGLSKATLVTEAAEDSGSLITAREALDQGRDVFAIPGPITSDTSLGTALLIKQGARLVTSPEEVLNELGISNQRSVSSSQPRAQLNEVENQICDLLTIESKQVDEICRELKLTAAIVSASLIKMEIFGIVRNLGGGVYLKVR